MLQMVYANACVVDKLQHVSYMICRVVCLVDNEQIASCLICSGLILESMCVIFYIYGLAIFDSVLLYLFTHCRCEILKKEPQCSWTCMVDKCLQFQFDHIAFVSLSSIESKNTCRFNNKLVQLFFWCIQTTTYSNISVWRLVPRIVCRYKYLVIISLTFDDSPES